MQFGLHSYLHPVMIWEYYHNSTSNHTQNILSTHEAWILEVNELRQGWQESVFRDKNCIGKGNNSKILFKLVSSNFKKC